MPDETQLGFDFDAADREAERLAAMPQKNDRRNRILQASIKDGADNKGQCVKGWTLKLVLLAINSFDYRQRSTKVIGERCGNPEWAKLIPNGRKLSPRTVKSAIQAMERMDLLDRIDKGKRTERRVILWQNLRPALMGATASAMGATVPPIGATAPQMGATVAPPIHEGNQETNHEGITDDADDDGFSFLEEKGRRFFERFGGGADPLIRERVFKILLVERRGLVPKGTVKAIVRELTAMQRKRKLKDLRAILYRLMLNAGHNLDQLALQVPDELVAPPATAATISTTKGR